MSQTYNIRIRSEFRESLELLAVAHNCLYAGKPSVPLLVQAIAVGEVALFHPDTIDKICANRATIHQQDINVDSFRGRLIAAIAEGLASNAYSCDHSPEAFAEIVLSRVNAIIDNDPEPVIYSDFPE